MSQHGRRFSEAWYLVADWTDCWCCTQSTTDVVVVVVKLEVLLFCQLHLATERCMEAMEGLGGR